jgi:hypothetical protein
MTKIGADDLANPVCKVRDQRMGVTRPASIEIARRLVRTAALAVPWLIPINRRQRYVRFAGIGTGWPPANADQSIDRSITSSIFRRAKLRPMSFPRRGEVACE